MDGNIATLIISTHIHTHTHKTLCLGALFFWISFRKCKLSVDLCEWIGKVEGCRFDKQDFFISLEVQEMAGSSVPGSGQAVSTQLDCLRSHKYIWLCWLHDAIKAAKALKRWCLRDPRLHWSEMRLRLGGHMCALTHPPSPVLPAYTIEEEWMSAQFMFTQLKLLTDVEIETIWQMLPALYIRLFYI